MERAPILCYTSNFINYSYAELKQTSNLNIHLILKNCFSKFFQQTFVCVKKTQTDGVDEVHEASA